MFNMFKVLDNEISNISKTQKEYGDQIEPLVKKCEKLCEAFKKKKDKESKGFEIKDRYQASFYNIEDDFRAGLTMDLNPEENSSGFSVPKDIPLLIKDIEILQDTAVDYLKKLKKDGE